MLTDTEEQDATRDESPRDKGSGRGEAESPSVVHAHSGHRSREGLGSAAIGGMGIGMVIGGIPVIPLAAFTDELFGGQTWPFYVFILVGGVLGLLAGALWHQFR